MPFDEKLKAESDRRERADKPPEWRRSESLRSRRADETA
jgi:hypothetical protein